MQKRRGRVWFLATILVLLAACSPSPRLGPTADRVSQAATAVPVQAGPTRITVAIGAEITSLASKLEPQRTYGGEYGFLSNSPLVLQDEKGHARPLLAAELPSRDAGSWTINADGTMATTWKLRPNARWHDGQPVSPQDFVLALRVYSDPAMPIREREPERFMDRIEPIDATTFVLHWKQPYPWAGTLINRQLEPLPNHIMASVLDAGDRDAFLNHSFWTSTSYVGTGPYRLVQWDLGSQLVYRAFDDYFLGRPKLDEIVVRIIPDSNTLVSNLLSGAVDATLGVTMGVQAGVTVATRWREEGLGQVIVVPARFRYTQLQFDPAKGQEPALQDVRVRRAIVHAIDRETMAQIVTEGTSGAADVMMGPTDPLFPRMQQAIMRYPHDLTRAAALLQDAGWSRRGDLVQDAAGRTLKMDIKTTQGRDSETEASIMAANLTQAGFETSQTVVPASRVSDTEFRVTFAGLNVTAVPIDIPASMNVAHGDQCATAERRYVGTNRGCWRNADFDRLYLVASSTLDQREREDAVVAALRIMTEEVGIFGLAYNAESIAVRKGLTGPGNRWPPQVGTTWNVHEWSWQQ